MLGGPEVKALLEARLHLLPPLRWRLVQVPLGPRPAVLGRGPGLRPRVPRPRDGAARAGRRPPARRDRAARVRPPARPRPPAVGDLRHPRARGRARGAADEDPPLGRGRDERQRDHGRACSTRSRAGVASTPRRRARPQPATIPRDREMLLRGLRGLPRQPLRALRSLPRTVQGFTDLPGANALPGVPTLSHVYSRVRRTLGSDESTDILEVTKARAAEDAVQRARSPRTGGSRSARSRSTPCARSGATSASRSTTSSSRCAPARCASGCSSATRCPRTRSWR